MTIIWFLMPIAFLLAGVFVFLFIWMIKDGQYDDLDTPPFRVLLDDTVETKTNAQE